MISEAKKELYDITRVLLFGDNIGIPQLLQFIPKSNIIGIVSASIRPQYYEELKQLSDKLNVPILVQPKWQSQFYDDFLKNVAEMKVDLIWVNSYSMIIRDDVLNLPNYGALNIHAALLPRNRGCNPIQWAIINGDSKTGVTLHEVNSGIDSGPIIDQRSVSILFEDTWITVRDRLYIATNELIQANIDKILSGNWASIAQNEDYATFCRRRTMDDGAFTWSEPVIDIYNKIRALIPPLPAAFFKNKFGIKHCIESYQTIWQVTSRKYSSEGGRDIQSKSVRLRPLQKDDLKLLHEWTYNDELVDKYSPLHPVLKLEHERWVEHKLTKGSDLVMFVIEDQETREAIGSCQLININWIYRSAELQMRFGISTSYDKGHDTEVVKLLIEYGFKDLNLHRIYLHVSSTNKSIINEFKKCGFSKERTLFEAAFIDGKWIDVFVMVLIRRNKYESYE